MKAFIIVVILFAVIPAQRISKKDVIYRIAEIVSDTLTYSKKVDDFLPIPPFDIMTESHKNCAYCYGWKCDKLNLALYIRFHGEPMDSVLQQISLYIDDAPLELFDSIHTVIRATIKTDPDEVSIEEDYLAIYWNLPSSSILSLDCQKKNGKCESIRLALDANTSDEEY